MAPKLKFSEGDYLEILTVAMLFITLYCISLTYCNDSNVLGEKVLCFHGPLIYEAKCLKSSVTKDKHVRYLIHYAGWNKKYVFTLITFLVDIVYKFIIFVK